MYYTLLMAILHRRHNLGSDRMKERAGRETRQSDRKDDKMNLGRDNLIQSRSSIIYLEAISKKEKEK